ncbi:hypothetical protein RISK_001332 [Rhodopirellula islandica]|uniref:Uncharacterized protein n=1 Tax=Rhodopirellula islandica TaxID=595434 RepID=A0A0J1BJ80_RHOIS|nr:hypothetical protein RISK_001332 [Rhodopirellula islandica]
MLNGEETPGDSGGESVETLRVVVCVTQHVAAKTTRLIPNCKPGWVSTQAVLPPQGSVETSLAGASVTGIDIPNQAF